MDKQAPSATSIRKMIVETGGPNNGKLFLLKLLSSGGPAAVMDFVERANNTPDATNTLKVKLIERAILLSLPMDSRTRRYFIKELCLNAAVLSYATSSVDHLFDEEAPLSQRAHSVVGYTIAAVHAWTVLEHLTREQLEKAVVVASALHHKLETERHNQLAMPGP